MIRRVLFQQIFACVRIALLPILCVLSCQKGVTTNGCTQDSECGSGFVCQTATHTCHCASNDACAEGEYCNTQGYCQNRPPCIGNKDCPEGQICNSSHPSGGLCIPANTCGDNNHCPFNQYCHPNTHTCASGCLQSSDCQLGWVCAAGQCVAGACQTCPVAPDADPSYCSYGDQCSPNGHCTAHALKSNLCQTCGPTQQCPRGLICLIDNDGTNYCAPSCTYNSDCPSGYTAGGCVGLQVVQEECTGGHTCSNGGRCIGSPEGRSFCECKSHSDCALPTGLCMLGRCMVGSGGACRSDSDCICQQGRCIGSDFACTSAADCELRCVQHDDGQGNQVGSCETKQKACGKETGVTCQELTRQAAPCGVIDQDGGGGIHP